MFTSVGSTRAVIPASVYFHDKRILNLRQRKLKTRFHGPGVLETQYQLLASASYGHKASPPLHKATFCVELCRMKAFLASRFITGFKENSITA